MARGITRADAARAMGVNRFTLANIERQQSPLKFSMGYNLCLAHNLCLRWLATGMKPIHMFTYISAKIFNDAGPALLFSQGYDLHLSSLVDAELVKLANAGNVAVEDLGQVATVKNFFPIGVGRGESSLEAASNSLRNFAETLDDDAKMALARRVIDLLALPRQAGQAIDKKKDNLDNKNPQATVANVSLKVPTWLQLKKTIASLTAAHGQKTALADELGVSRQVLGNWLSSDDQGAPSAELTLRLLKWSLDPKRQAK